MRFDTGRVQPLHRIGRIALIALGCTAVAIPPCRAWNDLGHMTVAAIAYADLTPAARARSGALLRLNPDYASWIRNVPTPQRDRTAFLEASNWPDAIKHSHAYRNDGERPSGPGADRNTGYADRLQHRYWHFIDVPLSRDGVRGPAPLAPNVETQIARFRRTLSSPSVSDEVKSYDLVWLLHLVGDIHQPLHTVSRYSREQPEGDAGGNRVRLCAPPCRLELHAFWDDLLGHARRPEAALRLAQRMPRAPEQLASVSDESSWVRESVEIARDVVYGPPIGPGAGPYPLTTAYREHAREIARRRIALAGARLARLLNSALR